MISMSNTPNYLVFPPNIFNQITVNLIPQVLDEDGDQCFILAAHRSRRFSCCEKNHTISLAVEEICRADIFPEMQKNPFFTFLACLVYHLETSPTIPSTTDSWVDQRIKLNSQKFLAFLREEELEWLNGREFTPETEFRWELPS